MSSLVVGDNVSAVVTSIASYGVLIEYCNKKGFIQIPELSWDIYGLQDRIETICKVGDTLQVKVLAETDGQVYDFYGSVKALTPELDPWNEINKPVVGQNFQGKVVLVAEYGYLVKLPNFIVSVLPNNESPELLESGQIIDVEISSVDYSEKKVFLTKSKKVPGT